MKKFSIAILLFLLSGLPGAVFAAVFDTSETTVRLAPAIRTGALPAASAPGISLRTLASFLVQPVMADSATLARAPRIVAATDARVYLGKGDRIHAEGNLQGELEFRIVRRVLRLQDPVSGEYLGDELMQLGTAKLWRESSEGAHGFLITDSRQEIVAGDLLLPLSTSPAGNSVLPTDMLAEASIVSIADGTVYAAQNQIVSINKGARDQVAEGASFALFAAAGSRNATHRQIQTQQQSAKLPQKESGRLLIFRVFDRVSYGLITQADEPLQVGDKARAPH